MSGIEGKQYKEFILNQLFDVTSSKKIYHGNTTTVYSNQDTDSYPYVVRSERNNGIRGYLKENPKDLNPGNTISFAQDTFVCFYQKQPYFTGNKIKVLIPKNKKFGRRSGLYIVTALNKTLSHLSWGTGSNTGAIELMKISLPITSDGEPDYEFMAEHIRKVEAEHIRKVEAYLKVAGFSSLTDTMLTAEEQDALNTHAHRLTKRFKLGELFTVHSNPQLDKRHFKFGGKNAKYPYFTRTVLNNGISGYVEYLDNEHLISKNCLAVGMLGMEFFYMDKDFYAGQFTKSIRPKGFVLTKDLALYFKTILDIRKEIFASVLVRDFERVFKEQEIDLPVTLTNEIDFKALELYIRATQKLVVQNLVKWVETQEEALKRVATGSHLLNT